MKKILLTIYSVLVFSFVYSQADESWRVGVQWGVHSSQAYLTGGMSEASALFGTPAAGGGAFELLARYDHNKHWMLTSGFGIQTFGFEFTLAQDYSLLHPGSRDAILRAEFGTLEVPVMLHYKFAPNCRNSKWVVGAGWVPGLIGKQSSESGFTLGAEAAANADYIRVQTNSAEGLYNMLRFTIGREKLLKKGGIFNFSMVFNAGLSRQATANVNYRVNGRDYEHSFGTKGSFIGFRLAYFLRPFPETKSLK